MVKYIDDHKDRHGVEPICRHLQFAPSTYYEQKLRQRDPSRLPARTQRDIKLRPEIHRVWHENFCVYGVRKTWKQLNREHIRVAKCTVERLMRGLNLRGAVRGKGFKTTIADESAWRPAGIWSIDSSPLSVRISCGWRTSRMSPPGAARCSSPS
jgi:putative transposase